MRVKRTDVEGVKVTDVNDESIPNGESSHGSHENGDSGSYDADPLKGILMEGAGNKGKQVEEEMSRKGGAPISVNASLVVDFLLVDGRNRLDWDDGGSSRIMDDVLEMEGRVVIMILRKGMAICQIVRKKVPYNNLPRRKHMSQKREMENCLRAD